MGNPGSKAPVYHNRHGPNSRQSAAAQISVTQDPDTLQRYPLSSITGAVDGAGVMVEHMQSAECFHTDYQAVRDPAGRCLLSRSYNSLLFILGTLK